ncbi:MAG TPA: exosortase/archaeosortase family protein [Candidatus Saccharimonadales bacterium]|nr:exosortase/archaeosortase family protein [Candidatus Saccharimonadales bacterium]
MCRQLPNGWMFLVLLAAWIALFQFLGNSTLGYVNTSSLFGWWTWINTRGAIRPDGSVDLGQVLNQDEAYAWFIPAVVLVLLWCRRHELLAMRKDPSWAGLGMVALGAFLHVIGFMIQQTRVSVLGFSLGIYGLTGLLWGGAWMRATLLPFSLLLFCIPLTTSGDPVTLPLRVLATKITTGFCHVFLGINVIRSGTQLFDPGGAYQYEVAAACSGIRSLTAALAFGVILGYLQFKSPWRRIAIVASAFPLAVASNVFRLSLIVLAAEAFGQKAGDYVHESSWLSLLPYVPSIGGMLVLAWWLGEDRKRRPTAPVPPATPVVLPNSGMSTGQSS